MPTSIRSVPALLGLALATACAHLVPDGSHPAGPARQFTVNQRPQQRLAPFYWTASDTVRFHFDAGVSYRLVVSPTYAGSGAPGLTFWPADSALPTSPRQYERLLQSFSFGGRDIAYIYTAPRTEDYLFLPPVEARLTVAPLRTSWSQETGQDGK